MNKQIKKSFSLLLTVLMLVSCFSIGMAPAYAADLDASELNAVIEQANAITADDYVDVSSLTAAVESANNATLDTQTKIDDATAKIQLELLKLEQVHNTTSEQIASVGSVNAAKLSSYKSDAYAIAMIYADNSTSGLSAPLTANTFTDDTYVIREFKDVQYERVYQIGATLETVFKHAYANYVMDRYSVKTLSDLGEIINVKTHDSNGTRHHAYVKFVGDIATGKEGVATTVNGKEFRISSDFAEDYWCSNESIHEHWPYINKTSALIGDLPEAGDSVKLMLDVKSYKPDRSWRVLEVNAMLGFQFDAYDTTALREAIAKTVDNKSAYSPLSYSVYLSALENAMNVLNTPVTVKVNEDDEANYADIAAAQAAIDAATDRLNNAYNALDKDFVIEYYSDGELFNSQTVLYSDIAVATLISDIPEKYGYVFTAWTDSDGNKYTSSSLTSALAPANGSKVKLTAEFESDEYTVTFVNYDGTVLETKSVKYSQTADYTGAAPTKPADGDTVYNFSGWDKDITAPITSDTVFTAVFDSHTHSFTELVEVINAATCTETGLAKFACSCGETRELATPIDPDNHDLVHHEAKIPTCTESGWYEYDTCSRCDYTTFVSRDKVAHTPGDVKIENVIAAACLDNGSYDEVVYCSVCNEELSRETKTQSALGHDLIHHDAKAPTCSSVGHIAYDTCSRCDYTNYEEIPVDSAAHKYGEWIVDGEASCLTGGTKHRVCEYDPSHIETADIPATGAHSFGDGVVTLPPTCSAEGVKTYTCSACGFEKTENIAIDPDAHSYGEFITVKPATCTADGEMRKVCEYNDSHYISELIPASGHNLVHHDGKAATCKSEGYKPYDACANCDYSTYAKIAKLSHNFVLSEHKDSTCKVKGYDLYKCTLCGDIKKTELALKSHSWDDGVITKEPTAEQNGEKTYTCKTCGLTKTVKLYLCSHCSEIFEGDESYNAHIADVGSVCPYCGHKHDQYFEHMTFIKLKCFLTRLFTLLFGFFKGLK